MGDPVIMTVVGVGAALTKVFLRACDAALAADVVADVQELLGALSRASHRSDGSRDQIELRVRKALAARLQEMHKHRYGRDIDRQLLSGACTEVEIILNEIADDGELILSAALNPDSLPAVFHSRASQRRLNIEEAAEPYFDELIEAAATQYAALAPWSTRFQIEAFKSILSGIDEIQENSRRSLDAHAVTQDKIDTLSSKFDEVVRHENKLSRVFFGSRPDVVVENRFVERSEQEHLNALIADPTRRRTVLVGMRGCGKTQLASALAQQCEDANWSLVAWVNASSTESITSDLVELARELKIDTSDQPAPEFIIPRLFTRLNSADPSDRLIVFDNVENIDDLPAPVPRCKGLRVVATTTNKAGWEDQGWNSIKVGVFDRVRSIDYLLTVTKSDDHDTADALAERLGDLPLAIAQAAATARNRDLSLARYMDRLDSYRSERVIRPVPGDYYPKDVATALCMAIEEALENLEDGTKQAALRQLGALALLAESGVPTRWLDPTIEHLDDRGRGDANQAADDDAHDALTELIHRSIVQQSADKATTVLHRLQAQAFRESWTANETEEASKSAAIVLDEVSIDSFPRTDTDSRLLETRNLIEQLRTIGEQAYSYSLLEYDEVCSILLETMLAADDLGMSLELMTLKNTLEVLKESIGPNHAVTLSARSILAHSYQRSGHIEKAISMLEELLETSRYDSEQGSAFTLSLSNNLANAYQEAGRNDKAISIYETLIEQTINSPTPDYRTSFTLHNSLAKAYLTAGRLDEAISIFEKTLVRCVNTFGEGDLDALSLCDNLAGAYELDGRLDDTICLHQMVLAARTDILGERHADTLTTASNLACAYQSSGRLDEAINLLTTTLASSEQSLGKDNPITCTIRDNLASVYRSARRFPEAITLLMQSIEQCINSFGPRAHVTHHLLELLADTFISAGEPSGAIPLFALLTSVHSKLAGPEDVDALRSRNNLAFSYALSGNFPEAITQWQAILTDCERCLGPNHSITTDVSNNLEAAKRELKRQEEDSAAE